MIGLARGAGVLPGLVGDPLLVDVLVQPRHHPHHFAAPRAHQDVAAHSVQHVDGLRLPVIGRRRGGEGMKSQWEVGVRGGGGWFRLLPGLPRPRGESVRLGRERPHGADVDDVARELRHEHFLHVGSNLQVVASAGRAQVFHPCDLAGEAEQKKKQKKRKEKRVVTQRRYLGKFAGDGIGRGEGGLPDAACALDAARHDGLDERPDVFVLHCPLPLRETTAV